jgi:hypothetical protein
MMVTMMPQLEKEGQDTDGCRYLLRQQKASLWFPYSLAHCPVTRWYLQAHPHQRQHQYQQQVLVRSQAAAALW